MKKSNIIFLFILFSSGFVHAQNIEQIKGAAFDKKNKTSLMPDSIVIGGTILNVNRIIKLGDNRFFVEDLKLNEDKNCRLQLFVKGYKKIDTTINLNAKESSFDLGKFYFTRVDTTTIKESTTTNKGTSGTNLDTTKKQKKIKRLKLGEAIQNKDFSISVVYLFLNQKNNTVEAKMIPSDYRRIPPHSEDVLNRPDDIIDINVPDNYFIQSNAVSFDIINQNSIQFDINLFHYFSISLRTTDLILTNENNSTYHHRKDYILPNHGGSSFIYYEIKPQGRKLFSPGSYSMPVTFKFPFVYYRESAKNPIYIYPYLGTNALLQSKIKIISEKGWERYGDYELYQSTQVGTIKELEWFIGLKSEIPVSKQFYIGAFCEWVNKKYRTNINDMDILIDNSKYFLLGLSLVCSFK